MNGAPASRASRREISVFPTPVGPIIRIFFGSTSSRSLSSSCKRRQRLRSAIATARLASPWPMMKRSSSETISRGEKSVITSVRKVDRVAFIARAVGPQRQHCAVIEAKRESLVFQDLHIGGVAADQRQHPGSKRDDELLIVGLGSS